MFLKQLLACAIVLICGCGSSELAANFNGQLSTPEQTAINREFSAQVVDESGQGVAEVDVVLHERRSNLKYSATTDSSGSFVLDMPIGVYDIGLNNASDPGTATCFYGPVSNFGGSQPTYVLRSTGGRSTDTLFWARCHQVPVRQVG